MFLALFVGIGVAAVAAVTIIYISMRSKPPRHQYHRRRQSDRSIAVNAHNDQNDNDPHGLKDGKLRKSCAGDKCMVCHEVMISSDTMQSMHCGHALHIPCFQEYREISRQCPYCNQLVIRIDLPGENCAICELPLEEDDMEYLKCEHALHRTCLEDDRLSKYDVCPNCKQLKGTDKKNN